jgi:hypothetical protein
MDRLRDRLLAGSGFAMDKHGGTGRSDEVHLVKDVPESMAVADEIGFGSNHGMLL